MLGIKKSEKQLILFVLPAMSIYILFFILPMINGIYYSTTDWNGMSKVKHFVGIKNYIAIFNDAVTLRAIKNTLIYTIVVTFFSIIIGLILSLMLEKRSKINTIYRTIFFMPAVLSPVVSAFIWKYMYSPESGVINSILKVLKLNFLVNDWLGNHKLALISVMIVPLWQFCGNVMVVFLAGLMNIPIEYYEAAAIDGMTYIQRLKYITLPLLRPAMVFNVVISTIGSLKTFDFIFILTNGGPGFFTEVLTLRVYNFTLYTSKFGYGTAVAMILTMLVVIFSLTELKLLTRNSERYD